MDYEPIDDDSRSPSIVGTAPLEEDDSAVQIKVARRMRHVVSGQEGAA